MTSLGRREQILAAINTSGLSYGEIARQFGISRQRVSQIAVIAGLPERSPGAISGQKKGLPRSPPRSPRFCKGCGVPVAGWANYCPSCPPGIVFACQQCGKVKTHRVDPRHTARFCSRACQGRWLGERGWRKDSLYLLAWDVPRVHQE